MEPLALITGGAIFLVGWLCGRITRPRREKSAPDIKPICGCGHHFSSHDPKTKACNAKVQRKVHQGGAFMHNEYKPCSCLQYVGPLPIDTFYAPEITG